MNCYKCQKRIATPNETYSVAELVDMCRPCCVACDPEQMPRGGYSQVQLNEGAIGYTVLGGSVDETGDDGAPSADNGGETFQRIHPDFQDARTGGHASILNVPDEIAVYLEPFLMELLKRFAALDIADVDVLHGMLNGMSCGEMARAFGYKNKMTVHVRLRNALTRNPWMKEIYTRGSHYGIRELRHSSPSWQKKIEKPFTRGRGVVLADVPGADPDALADAVDGGKRNRRVCPG